MSRARGLAATLSTLLIAACGYTTRPSMPAGVSEVAVEIAANDSRFRQLEIAYSRTLSREFLRRAGVRIQDPGRADAILSARIFGVERRPLVQRDLDELLEDGVIASVEVRLVDARSGEPLIEPFVLSGRAEAVILRPETVEAALEEVMGELAERTVDRVQGLGWMESRAPSVAPHGP